MFYNSLLKELCDDICEIISPVQFVQYVLGQRILRWQIVKGFDQVKQFYENITSDNSKDGYASNIKEYTTDDNMVNYHSFSEPNVCLAWLQVELCRATNTFATR